MFVFDGTEGILLEVTPDPSTWPRIHAAWDEFMRFVATSQPPPLTDRDTRCAMIRSGWRLPRPTWN